MEKFRVATKANPWYKDGKTFDDPVAGLNGGSVKEQLRASLASLRYGRVHLFATRSCLECLGQHYPRKCEMLLLSFRACPT